MGNSHGSSGGGRVVDHLSLARKGLSFQQSVSLWDFGRGGCKSPVPLILAMRTVIGSDEQSQLTIFTSPCEKTPYRRLKVHNV